jgi:hypothetical protein
VSSIEQDRVADPQKTLGAAQFPSRSQILYASFAPGLGPMIFPHCVRAALWTHTPSPGWQALSHAPLQALWQHTLPPPCAPAQKPVPHCVLAEHA